MPIRNAIPTASHTQSFKGALFPSRQGDTEPDYSFRGGVPFIHARELSVELTRAGGGMGAPLHPRARRA